MRGLSGLQDRFESLDVGEILGAVREAFEGDQIRNGCDTDGRRVEGDDLGPGKEPFELDRVLDEQIDLTHGMGRIPQRENPHTLVAYPRLAHDRIGERHGIDRRTRSQTESDESLDRPPRFDRGQIDYEIDIGRESREPMQNRRDTADHDIPHVGAVQGIEERLQQ